MFLGKKIKSPYIDGDYRSVYIPKPTRYAGPDTESFRKGELYTDWIANDFSVLKGGDGCWHAIGIIHPRPPRFTDAFDFDETNVHEAESQLFHAVFRGSLRELYESGQMEQQDILLYPQERPDEAPECWAPAVFRCGDGYRMLYTPECMKTAVSSDLYHWEPGGELFRSGNFWMRDPYVFTEGGKYHLIYNDKEYLWRRETTDFVTLSEPRVLYGHVFGEHSSLESPCLVKKDGMYYLLWCIYDGQNGCYDNRTYVFASETLDGFNGKSPLTVLKGHAPELVCEDGEWYIFSVFYPQNGLSIAKIRWDSVF